MSKPPFYIPEPPIEIPKPPAIPQPPKMPEIPKPPAMPHIGFGDSAVNQSGEHSVSSIYISNLFICMYLLIFPRNKRCPPDSAEAEDAYAWPSDRYA